MPLLAQVGSEGQGAESETTHTLAGVLYQTIPGNRSTRNLASTDPELTGETKGRFGLGNLDFSRSFAGRDEPLKRIAVWWSGWKIVKRRRAINPMWKLPELKLDSCGGVKSY